MISVTVSSRRSGSIGPYPRMSSVISRTICRRSSRVSGVRSSTSCSVTARRTRSCRSSVISCLNSSTPTVAMTPWWIRVFSSAYGSTAPGMFAARSRCVAGLEASVSATADDPFVAGRLRRSWRPIALPLRQRPEQAALLRRLRLRQYGFGKIEQSSSEVAVLVVEDDGLASVHAERNGAVGRQLMADLHSQRVLHLARLHPHLRVGTVEDDADAVARER